jgi:cytidine deaminase
MQIFKKTSTPLTNEEIFEWLKSLRGNPYNPASKFDVTTVFRAKLGEDEHYYFAGVNVENLDHRLTTHGEEGCIAAMVTGLGNKAEIAEIWLMGAPRELTSDSDHPLASNTVSCCGKCRQQIASLANPEAKVHSFSLKGDHKTTTVGEFLTDVFSFKHFAPELLTHNHQLNRSPSHEEVESKIMRQGHELSHAEIFAWLQELESVDFASHTSQAVILKLDNGAYVAGVRVEEAAFLSADPIQNALAIANAEFGKPTVTEVWSYTKKRPEQMVEFNSFGASTLSQFSAHKNKTSGLSQALSYTPLTLSAVQVLAEFAKTNITIHLLNSEGRAMQVRLNDCANVIPTFTTSKIEIEPAKFKLNSN